MITYASVCSGIESPSVAWEGLGWKSVWFSEIEKNASKVLEHYYPTVPNLGDMTKIAAMIDNDEVDAPDILVGGTPCQAFSVAGLRKGLEDDRGNLTLVFAHLIESCDEQRRRRGLEPVIVIWENVKGVLSDKTNAFGNFISLLVGEDEEIVNPKGKWTNAGCVFGPKRAIAWRVLDAQHFGVPQRRHRVFLIASARKGFRPYEVLFEFQGVRRDSAPSREAWKNHSEGVEGSVGSSRKGIELAGCDAIGEGSRYDMETCSLIPVAFNHQSGGSLMNLQPSENLANTVQRSQGQAISVRLANTSSNGCGFQPEINRTLDCAGPNAVYLGGVDYENNFHNIKDVTGPLLKGSPTGGGRPLPALIGYEDVCFAQNTRDEVRTTNLVGALASQPGMKQTSYVKTYSQVRKLTPTECERLMGFPDGYTSILSDTNRYKVLGNSIVTNCLKWIGERISCNPKPSA